MTVLSVAFFKISELNPSTCTTVRKSERLLTYVLYGNHAGTEYLKLQNINHLLIEDLQQLKTEFQMFE